MPPPDVEPLRITSAGPSQQTAVAALVRDTGMQVDVPAELARRFSRIWLAWLSNWSDPVGFLLAWEVVDELHVLDVATHPAFRRRGIARALLRHAITHAQRRCARIALLEVRRSNAPAIALYSRHGFEETSVRRAYYADGEDALEMALALDPLEPRQPAALPSET